ncbi:MAG: quinone oxidoreductase [Gammaproteobacteria bacterium]|nr:quinone oxidoreductase [Gammaproteobacteria bacterium]
MKNRAIKISQYGTSEVLELVNAPAVGEPQAHQVKVRHQFVGLNFIDIYQRTGLYPLPLPAQLGMEASGIVETVGMNVRHLKAGDRVAYTTATPGCYADVRLVDAKTVCRLPDSIDLTTGAAMMLKGLTVQYLFKRSLMNFVPGDFVLFHAAAGGVGLIACQWAKFLGLRLIGTAGSDDKCALAIHHGAEFAINYQKDHVVARVKDITGGVGVKAVFDSVGKDTWDLSLDCLRPLGLLVSYGNASGAVPPFAPGVLGAKGSLYVTRQTLFSHIADFDTCQQMADDLFSVVAQNVVKIPIHQTYDLEHIRQAHEDLEGRKTTGCSIITL